MEEELNNEVQEPFSDESPSSEEDENGDLINDNVESKFLSTLAKIRTKDPDIYNVKNSIFECIELGYSEQDFSREEGKRDNAEKGKKLTYKDMERQRILNKADKRKSQKGQAEPIEEEDEAEPTPYELQQKLKNQFKKVAEGVRAASNDGDDFFKVKPKKATAAVSQPKEVLKKFAKDHHEEQILDKFWGDDSKLNETDLFLKRYILSKGWVDASNDQSKKKVGKKVLKEDDERSEEMEDFEERYNFRFEEPGGTDIQTFPRQIEESMRLKKQARKDKRKRKQQEKKKDLQQALRHAEKQKAKKKEEIRQRIAEIQQDKGEEVIEVEQQGDEQQGAPMTWFYCDDCQRGLAESEQYYVCTVCEDYSLCKQCYELIIHKHPLQQQTVPEGCGAPQQEEVKRILSEQLKCRKCKSMIDEYSKRYELVDPDNGFTYNYCEQCQDLLPLSLRKKCHQKKPQKVKLDQLLTTQPEKLAEYVEDDEVDRLLKEYLGLDYDKIIADGIRTKFKYIDVKPEGYGLSDEQLLFSDDKELNKYVSIKKLAPYREQNLRLRNSIYNKKIGGISRSAKLNRKRVQADEAGDPSKLAKRKMQILRERVERRKQNTKARVERLRLLNLSTPEMEAKHFVPKSRLESYGLTE